MGYAENALINGVDLKLNSKVTKITFKDHWTVKINDNVEIKAKTIINCAGLYGD
jgi:glycerol-3-phosphate dehydrogenase